MDLREILGKLADRQVEGLMIHEQMSDLFDLLNLHGYKRWNEYRFIEEAVNMKLTKRFCISTTNKLALTSNIIDPKGLPQTFFDKSRSDIDNKLAIVRGAFEKLSSWESETLKILNELYIMAQQRKAGEVAQFIMESIKHVSEELKYINRELQTLKDVTSIDIIIDKQSSLHDCYKDKLNTPINKLQKI